MWSIILKRNFARVVRKQFYSSLTNFDIEYLCSPRNLQEIEENVKLRKRVGNAKLVQELYNELKNASGEKRLELESNLVSELRKLPNRTHPDVKQYAVDGSSKVVKKIGSKKEFSHNVLDFQQISKRMNLMRSDQLGHFSGSKSYYLYGNFANLERALIRHACKSLLDNSFELVSVPDIIPRSIIESCGLISTGVRNQVFALNKKLHKKDMCLSGTSEMSLAALYKDHIFEEHQLPIKLAAVSRCYRAETSNLAEERGLYRVHEFTKVEMFLIVAPEQSDSTLEYIRAFQENHFTSLDLHMKVLDMAPHELGAPAYRKYDIEAWLPGRGIYGEISSCSNCTDYQSRRLGIKYRRKNGDIEYVHTLNGTASAIPRLLIALVENGQRKNGEIEIPKVLQGYMYGLEKLKKQTCIPQLKLVKNKKP